ncbi:MAG: GIY-YIG nuclease family protein, partial [Pirellulales bacterium]
MKKRTQLVCQHLEYISREALERYQDIIRQYIRGRHGIYALYRKGKLQYVGLASNLRARLHRHLRDRHKDSWDHFSVYLTIDNRGIKELETLLLR